MIYFCTNIIVLFASICESTTHYNHTYSFPPVSAPITLVKPPRVLDLQFFYPHHLDLLPGHPRVTVPPSMKEIPTTPPLPNAPPAQDFSKLEFVYITVLGLANQVVPHTGSWYSLATEVNYLVRIAPIVYMAFQAQPASPVGVQLDSDLGCDAEANTPKLTDIGITLGSIDNREPQSGPHIHVKIQYIIKL
ncbi:hypothetical protein DSO57_1002655 [Entomophthora muscae]|uniref:Uncharacterized protein n=1 Tax=Entomophthora muscae TaxID=34485 RepID=A0ACC2TJS8_9FUNG|nr:hypothetical protein DSO57_1002655 [Entomophthora muscae]